MSDSVHKCGACGANIRDAELESGAAIALLGRKYCPDCKGRAVKDVSLDDLAQDPSSAPPRPSDPTRAFHPPPAPAKAAPRPAKGAAPKAAAPPPARTPPVSRPASTARHRARSARRSPAKGPLIAVAGLGVAAFILTAIVVSVSGGGESRTGSKSKKAAPPPPPVEADPEALAKAAFTKAEAVSRRSDVDFAEVFAEIAKAKKACAGTGYEARLDALRRKTEKRKAAFEAEKALEKTLAELEKDVAADVKFLNYDAITKRFEKARAQGSKAGAKRHKEIQQLQADYNRRYEEAAAPFYDQIHQAAQVLAREGRFDDALAHIDTFPVHLRKSGAWGVLERLRKDIEARKRSSNR